MTALADLPRVSARDLPWLRRGKDREEFADFYKWAAERGIALLRARQSDSEMYASI